MNFTQKARILYMIAIVKSFSLTAQSQVKHASDAYQDYLKNFELYEKVLLNKSKDSYIKSIDQIAKEYIKDKKNISNKQKANLLAASNEYRDQLKNHPNSENRAHVSLSLAQTLLKLNDIALDVDQESKTIYLEEALDLLKYIDRNYSYFSRREESLYLMALCHMQLEHRKNAISTWKRLAKVAQNSIYGVYAGIAIGDEQFSQDKPLSGIKYYIRSYKLLSKLKMRQLDIEKLKLEYRILWSAYRTANFNTVKKFASKILTRNRFVAIFKDVNNIQLDAIELLGDSLFDQNSLKIILTTLREPTIKTFAPAIALQIIKRYSSSRDFEKVISLSTHIFKVHKVSREHPLIAYHLSNAYEATNKVQLKMKTLEMIAYYLPASSIFRLKYGSNLRLISEMEKLVFGTTAELAAWTYSNSLDAHQAHLYLSAANIFKILIDFRPQHAKATEWRVIRAHCHYFAGQFEESIMQYEVLKTNYSLTADIKEEVLFHIVLANEQKWRETFSEYQKTNRKSQIKPLLDRKAADLESSITTYLNEYPNKEKSIDLILTGANIYRDQGEYAKAIAMWQKVLLSKGSTRQRSIAIRGIVFATIAENNPAEAIKVIRHFIRSEQWSKNKLDLRSELLSVLSKATFDEAKQLKKRGYLKESGILLARTAKEFEGIPKRALLFRKGAFQLALQGEWLRARNIIEVYEKSGIKKYASDILYLKARTLEFMFNFELAASNYFALGKNYPKHKKARTSLQKASTLAEQEEAFDLAGRANYFLSKLEKTREEKYKFAYKSAQFFLNAAAAKDFKLAINRAYKNSPNLSAWAKIGFLEAEFFLKIGNDIEALKVYKKINKDLAYKKSVIGSDQWSEILAKVYLLKGKTLCNQLKDSDLISTRDQNSAIEKKLKAIQRVKLALTKSISFKDTTSLLEARWLLAFNLEKIAIELLSAINRNDSTATKKYKNRITKISQNFLEESRKLHGMNIISSSSNRNLLSHDIHVGRSRLRLAKQLKDLKDHNLFSYYENEHISYQLPYKWNL